MSSRESNDPSRKSRSVLVVGDCVEVMAGMDESSVDAVVCDPPYGLEFMGKEWDRPWAMGKVSDEGAADGTPFRRNTGTPSWAASGNPVCRNCGGTKYDRTRPNGCACDAPDFPAESLQQMRAFQAWCEAWAREALRVLRPGGYLLAFAGTRTYHRMTTGVEEAGFEVRDMLDWLYGSGFPKHRSALKPAHEPIVMARRPLAGTLEANLARHGTGALNIDGCRIESGERPVMVRTDTVVEGKSMAGESTGATASGETTTTGRWPANIVLDQEAAAQLDEQSGVLTSGSEGPDGLVRNGDKFRTAYGEFSGTERERGKLYGDSGGASRFFYVAKPDKSERHAGLGERGDLFAPSDAPERNDHPTVKPIALMRWLVRLVTPPEGAVLDPFTGSGSTGIAALLEGFSFVGVEREEAYAQIARARLAHWCPGVPAFVDLEAARAA